MNNIDEPSIVLLEAMIKPFLGTRSGPQYTEYELKLIKLMLP